MNNSESHFVKKLSTLAINFADSNESNSVVKNLASIESKNGDTLMSILNTIKYSIKEITNFECFKDHKVFTVWVGGVEINDYLLDLKSALNFYNHWVIEKNYDDVHISTVG